MHWINWNTHATFLLCNVMALEFSTLLQMRSLYVFALLALLGLGTGEEGARLLASKSLLNRYAVEGRDLTLQYNIYNVGTRYWKMTLSVKTSNWMSASVLKINVFFVCFPILYPYPRVWGFTICLNSFWILAPQRCPRGWAVWRLLPPWGFRHRLWDAECEMGQDRPVSFKATNLKCFSSMAPKHQSFTTKPTAYSEVVLQFLKLNCQTHSTEG